MPSKRDTWQTISLTPLTGLLDTRSRPADIPQGAFRWKLNMAVSPEGKLGRRAGFSRFWPNPNDPFSNGDFHHQSAKREPVTFMFESTENDGERRLFVGTESGIWLLDQTTGEYTSILSGVGDTGTRWHAAELQNVVTFVNNYDQIYQYDVTDVIGTQATVNPHFTTLKVSTAAVIASYNGFMVAMNVIQDDSDGKGAQRKSSRILWSDLNLPEFWLPDDSFTGSLAGFQDLDYGDDILAAAPLLGALYIFTRRSIWRMMPSGDVTTIFNFTKVYSEPKNQTGCIAYPNTLVSDGQDLWYMGRDGIYRYNPYIPVPVRDDWLHRADGLIYRDTGYMMDSTYCLSPIAEYMPTNREIWFSWPTSGAQGVNNYTLVAQTEFKTADVVDHGFTALVNFRLTPENAQQCNEQQLLLGASGYDWAIKSLGYVYNRELYTVSLDVDGLPTTDLETDADITQTGYFSIVRGMIPLGLTDRDKKVRKVLLDHDTSEQDVPCVVQLRIANAFSVLDPNSEATTCSPQWRVIKADGANGITNPPLSCPNSKTIEDLNEAGQRSNIGTSWGCMETGRFLFYEFKIMNSDESGAIGGDTFWQRIDFDATANPKPA